MATITLEKLTTMCLNGFKAIHRIDLAVADGRFIVIGGRQGCGKTTAFLTQTTLFLRSNQRDSGLLTADERRL
jgi:ABC-type sugar transport system ATPase subunit